jgi:hypothetical protein
MIISQSYEEIQAAAPLQSKCELVRIALSECHASMVGTREKLQPPFHLQLSRNSIANAIVENVLRIQVKFQVQGLDKSSPSSQLFGIECAFDLDYQIQDQFQPSTEAIAAFKDGNAVFNCWPYVREFIQSTVSRMSIAPPPIPLLRFIPRPKAAEAEPAEAPAESPKS